MFFNRKSKKESIKCENCNLKIENKFNFCPSCGTEIINENEIRDLGMLGKSDLPNQEINQEIPVQQNFGFTDKIISSIINSLIKNIDKQFKELDKTEVRTFPNGIKIRIGSPMQVQEEKVRLIKPRVTEEQIKRMSSLPRSNAKTSVKRLGDKVIYELSASGINSPEDVFVSKLESGYEIKAIGNKKVYINSLPINLPIRGFVIHENKLLVEFKAK